MKTSEILQSLPHLTPTEQLTIAETALALLQQTRHTLTQEQRRQQLAIAAISAMDDYSNDPELTVFTALDGEDFCDEA